MPAHHVLILGGHGAIAQKLTPLLLRRAWTVTSVIRTAEQVPAVQRLAADLPGTLHVLVRSIDAVASQQAAQEILDEVKPDYIAWSAGAGGKGGAEATFKIDRDAAVHFIRAAAATPSVRRLLLVSYSGSRRKAAPWWQAAEWAEYDEKVNRGVLATYHQAKIVADEALYAATRRGSGSTLTGICLRPGTLSDGPAGGVELGKTKHVKGSVPRETVAKVADALLAADGVQSGWLDLLEGEEPVDDAVAKAVKEGVDAAEGEAIHQQ
ncbi:NAD(P)-binding domain protein [Cordyceps fumosorosea ARSEF 2679]|uniref:NAD(P)-binding domain protein n=1 Tax=Cordyceps fumosorosea (strain ARSEF 2679) TaxID=1081104 RepID=A0A168CAW7_CORFA|nr:NAD(P)-binding domain protein [Cordyceps fumosorosea ARSEF 2679]OAA71167.1 NAD(P)-binding domain protein [Cordyceps fumosorosea ARSEF 2679]